MLQHRGGLAAYYDFHYADTPRPIHSDRYQVRFREPGSGFEYANLGYHRLGRLLERADGGSLADCLRERVFEPLGMADSHFADRYPGSAPAARRYTADGRAYPLCASGGTPAASAVWATAADLARFGHRAPGLLRPETAAATVSAPPITDHVGYGLGWIVSTGPGPQIRSHGGGMGGVAALLIAAPEQDLSVAVLTNSTDKAARDAIVEHVMTELVPGYRTEQITPFAADPAGPLTLAVGSRWAGRIATTDDELPISIVVMTEHQILLAVGGEAVAVAAGAHAAAGLRAVARIQLPTADARVNSPVLGLELNEQDGRLVGRAVAHKAGDSTGWLGNFLPHSCELARI
ncbi:serine hydrolase domain-containing protein [Kitasatospora humi]|uniref:serine hydrolase domain-containing protein n=1 Tax=Kitasatospora humi TaxID=2893891 RepID=UPI0024BF8FAB|nr:serine hydrolase domain-containing protein [Kitasatospora humi]